MVGLVIASYLVGSVSFAVVVSKAMSLPSPYSYGSENPGATNVLRTGNKIAALFTLSGDMVKGFLAVEFLPLGLIPSTILSAHTPVAIGLALLGVLLGHVFPVFHGFKGGKGVATAAGGLLAVNVLVGFSILLIWLAVSLVSRYSSLAAIFASFAAPFVVFWFTQQLELTYLVSVVGVVLLLRHKKNIINLLNGAESKIGKKNTTIS
ncbi:glycerol-3-phosphate 1-O-acyltransferase PlsY [Burkholderiales bacterium]|nr:glycerol-3-phosphate 1-O-acyltransferase PlsY [Burkholderiales bacterium]